MADRLSDSYLRCAGDRALQRSSRVSMSLRAASVIVLFRRE